MQFCDKCGALMIPVKKDKERVLKCRECGNETSLRKKGYKVEFRVKHSPREKIVVVEDETSTLPEMTEDERRERRKAILEHFEAED